MVGDRGVQHMVNSTIARYSVGVPMARRSRVGLGVATAVAVRVRAVKNNNSRPTGRLPRQCTWKVTGENPNPHQTHPPICLP